MLITAERDGHFGLRAEPAPRFSHQFNEDDENPLHRTSRVVHAVGIMVKNLWIAAKSTRVGLLAAKTKTEAERLVASCKVSSLALSVNE